MNKRAILYTRVGSYEQSNNNSSLQKQYQQLMNYCEQKDLEIVKSFTEFDSGKNADHPEFNKLLTFAKENPNTVDYLLFTTWDKLSRDGSDAKTKLDCLQRMNIQAQAITSPLTPPIDCSSLEFKIIFGIV